MNAGAQGPSDVGEPDIRGPQAAALPVALDAMGGDRAPGVVLTASRSLKGVLLVGREEALRPLPKGVNLPILHAPEVVEMGDGATAPLRSKPRCSIRVALEAVRDGQASSMVSCGHSGAVMAAALYTLGTLPGVDRPALVTVVPRVDGGGLALLDLGANVDCKPEHLACFASMGSAYARVVLGLERPRVGLLSNGEERSKGNQQVRAALPLLDALPLNFVGPVEPIDALRGAVDVMVCDGFAGNVMLKTVEATVEVTLALLKQEIARHPAERVGAWMLGGPLKRFRQRSSARAWGGALLLGVNGVVVIGHGRSDPEAVRAAVALAQRSVDSNLVAELAAAMSQSPQ